MAKKKTAKKETKSDFLRKVLGRNPNLDHQQVNRRWAKAGHAGEISNALYYKVRASWGSRRSGSGSRERGASPEDPARRQPRARSTSSRSRSWTPEPPIWRRIQVSDCTLDKLHEHIQTAMGWTNSHLHHFRIDGKLYGDPMLMAENFEELDYARFHHGRG